MKPLKFLMLQKNSITKSFDPALTGACAIDAVGVPYPDTNMHESRRCFIWTTGHPKYDNDPTAKVTRTRVIMRKN
jgi:3-isopropylmalate dehydrogenase